jgi:hypothetical protein
MKITITHNQASINPGATVPDYKIHGIIRNLEAEYTAALLTDYPQAEVEFIDADRCDYGLDIDGVDGDEYDETRREVQAILERVYETGTFWV